MRGALIAVCLAGALLAGAAQAQEPSKELKELRETSQALWRAGDYASALQFAEKALPLVVREYGAEHEQTGIQYFSLALISQALGNLARGRAQFQPTPCASARRSTAPTASSVAIALEHLGQVQLKRGRAEAAEPLFRRALKIKQDTVGRDHAFSASGHANLGDIGLARGNWAAARTSYREAIRLLTGQDTSYAIVKKLVEKEIKDFRDTFVGLCRAHWQLRAEPGSDRAAMIEETFNAAPARLADLGRGGARQDDGAAGHQRHRPRAAHQAPAGQCRTRAGLARGGPEAPHRMVCRADGQPDLQRGAGGVSRRQHRAQPRPGAHDQAPDRAGAAADGAAASAARPDRRRPAARAPTESAPPSARSSASSIR